MQSNPYLSFNGQCEAAFKFYEQLLGGKITYSQTWGNSPACEAMPPEAQGLIMHTTLDLGDSLLMGADSPPAQYVAPKGMHVTLHFKDEKEAARVFQSLAAGGTTQMEFGPTFFSTGFGMCADRYGIPWMVLAEQPQ
jgi:PhnB protein